MSVKHPIISVTGSSGAGTTSVKRTFEQIFRREGISAAFVEGDAFHRYDREKMKVAMAQEMVRGNRHFSHFGPAANLLEELETLFRQYGEAGTGRIRHYVHDAGEAEHHDHPPGTFTDWAPLPEGTDLLFYEGLHGAVVTDTVDTSNPFIARSIPTPDESMVVIRFRNPRGIDFSYLVTMIHGSFMSRANSIVISGGKLDLAMQLILTPMILKLMENKRRSM